jgi:hypothetical protein
MGRWTLLVGGLLCLSGAMIVICVLAVGGHFGVVSDWVRAALDAVLPRGA